MKLPSNIKIIKMPLNSTLSKYPRNHKLPTLSTISAITKIPSKPEITKLPLDCEIIEIPLPVNGHRNSTDGDGKLITESSSHAESNGGGGDLPHAVMAPDRAPKVMNPSTTDQQQNDVPGVSG